MILKLVVQILMTVVLFFGAMYSNLNAGSVCPPDTGTNCSVWEQRVWTSTTNNPQCLITVTYRFRICDNQYQIYYDDIRRTGNCENLGESWSNNEFNQTFMEWLDIVIMEDIVGLAGHPSVPLCPQETQKASFYSAGCGLWVKCTYIIDPERRYCEEDWRGEFPDYSENGEQKIDYWKWQSCGEVCCKKTYGLCRQEGTEDINIRFISKEKASECTNPDNFIKPCQDGC